MKKLLFLLLIAVNAFGQDLKLEHINSAFWQKTNYFTPCAGYDTGKYLIRLEYRITNLSSTNAVFPAYMVAKNTCRGSVEVNELITIQVSDKNGNVIHQHNDGVKVKDDGYYLYDVTLDGCPEPNYDPDTIPTGALYISAGYYHLTINQYPSGMQLGFTPAYIPYKDTFIIKSWLNTPYFDRGADCATDTTEKWYLIDPVNRQISKVAKPTFKTSAPIPADCLDADLPITTASINVDTRTITCDGSACGEKYIARYINFGAGQILPDDGYQKNFVFTFNGNSWVDNTALNQKDLEAYCALYPGVVKKGKPSYLYRLFNHTTTLADNITIKNVRYTK